MSDTEIEIVANEEALERGEVVSSLMVAKFAEAQQRIAKQARAKALEEAWQAVVKASPWDESAEKAIRALKERKP